MAEHTCAPNVNGANHYSEAKGEQVGERKLDPVVSSYLDLLRVLAAFAVLIGHMEQDGFRIGWIPLAGYSHEAVVAFFVLSGFIIYATTAYRRSSATHYAVTRMSRVYSVALPAIAFSVLLSVVVAMAAPELVPSLIHYYDFEINDLLGSALFLNQSWDAWVKDGPALTLNGPYWSLCYEVWYYIVFGVFFFTRHPLWRWVVAGGALIVAGPAIAFMFPIWCMGAWLAANWHRLRRPSLISAWAIFLSSIALIAAISVTGFDVQLRGMLHNNIPGFWRLTTSQRLITDHVIGVAVVAQIYSVPSLGSYVCGLLVRYRTAFARTAGFSFTLYLFHRPITNVSGALLSERQAHSIPIAVVSVMAVTGLCWLLSFATERRLPQWRQAIGTLLNGWNARLLSAMP